MTPRLAFLYLTGQPGAIRKTAESKSSVWTGLVLVLTAAIARNYDQVFLLERPTAFVEPVFFSFASAAFFFVFIYFLFIRLRPDPETPVPRTLAQFRSFLGLFWMTAPIAWLYAIPVERFLGSRASAELNIGLLAIVSLWRVLLLGRVFSVLQGVAFPRALGWVLLPACTEVAAFYIFGGPLAERIFSSMGGLQNSPEKGVLLDAMDSAFTGAIVFFVLTVLALGLFRNRGWPNPFPDLSPGSLPVPLLVSAFLGWTLIAVKPQLELQRNCHLEGLLEAARYGDALRFLSQHERRDFAPARRIAPSPYENDVFRHLPCLLTSMDGSEAKWVRSEYLDHFDVFLSNQIRHSGFQKRDLLDILHALGRIPEGPTWVKAHREEIEAERRTSRGVDQEIDEQIAAEVQKLLQVP